MPDSLHTHVVGIQRRRRQTLDLRAPLDFSLPVIHARSNLIDRAVGMSQRKFQQSFRLSLWLQAVDLSRVLRRSHLGVWREEIFQVRPRRIRMPHRAVHQSTEHSCNMAIKCAVRSPTPRGVR